MLDPWDDEADLSRPWYRRSDARWGLCAATALIVGFSGGYAMTWLREPDVVQPLPLSALHPAPESPLLGTMMIQVPGPKDGTPALPEPPATSSVTQTDHEPLRQGS